MKSMLSRIGLTPHRNLLTDVENRSVYSLSQCELNVFETYRQAEQVGLTFQNIVITSMVRGKKVMHLPGMPAFEYLPGETVLAPAGMHMEIDFPEAEKENPTQCIALTLNQDGIRQALDYLNEHFPKMDHGGWSLNYGQLHLKNSYALSQVMDKLVNVCKDSSTTKDVLADLFLKELIVRLVQTQSLEQTTVSKLCNKQHPFASVIEYIREHLTERLNINVLSRKACMSRPSFFRMFKRAYGISPAQYIIKERLQKAKQLLSQTNFSVTEIGLESGFEDVNHFIRIFKQGEGITPKNYRNHLLS